ncbi:MAG: recombinase family protein [Gammaproteobacteria bacterium]|nr:recombinase family protein [Gammaproteobacteria bacterium]
MNTEKIIYFEYARKSTEGDNRQVLSIEGQLQDTKKVIEREGLNVIKTFTDKKSAAIPFNRPAYTEMINRIKKGEANGIVVWHVDRLLRNYMEEGEFKWLLQNGIIKSIWTPYCEYRSEDNGLLFSIEVSVATQFSRDLSVKVRRGQKQKCEQGQPPIFAPIGYLNTKFATHGTNQIIEDPERFHIVRKGFDLLLSRQFNIPQIASILNDNHHLRSRSNGDRGGRPIHKSVLYKIFTNPFYYGYFNYAGGLYKGSYTPMITIDEFEQIQQVLGRKNKARRRKFEFAFTGLMKCGHCGCAITASSKTKLIKTTGQYKTFVFYHCTKRKGKDKCISKHYTTVFEMETLIEQELSSHDINPKFKEWAIRAIVEDHEAHIENQRKQLNEVLLQEQKISAELNTLLDLRINGTITDEKYIEKKSEKEAKRILLNHNKETLEKGLEGWIELFSDRLDFAVNVSKRFKEGDVKTQKKICLSFGWNWVLKDKKLIFNKPRWLTVIEEIRNLYEAEKERLELVNTFDEFKDNSAFEPIILALRRLRDCNRTENL